MAEARPQGRTGSTSWCSCSSAAACATRSWSTRRRTRRRPARATAAEPDATAKTVALHDHDGYRLAVVPASERLDVRRAREVLGATHHLRLATEEELRQDFPAFDVGAMPPFAPAPLPEVVDVRLLRHERIVCAGGEHERSVRIGALDLLRITEPRVADICEHPEDREPAENLPSF